METREVEMPAGIWQEWDEFAGSVDVDLGLLFTILFSEGLQRKEKWADITDQDLMDALGTG